MPNKKVGKVAEKVLDTERANKKSALKMFIPWQQSKGNDGQFWVPP